MNELLLEMLKYDNLTSLDAREICKMIEKKEILSKYTFPAKASKDGYFRIYVNDSSYKSGRKQIAAKSLEELKDKVYQHECGITDASSKSFKYIFELTQKEKLKYVKDKEKKLSLTNTIERIQRDYNRFFAGTDFEKMKIYEITNKDIENICYENLKNRDLRTKAFNNMRGILRSVFFYAYSEYLIKDNPYDRVNFKKFKDMFIKNVPIEDRMHSDEELFRMIDELHCKQQERPKYSSYWAMEFQILTGTRRGEIPPLTWEHIKEQYLIIEQSQITTGNTMHIVSHTKNYVKRRFPITDELNDFLKRLKERNEVYFPNSNFLFPANNELGTITNRAVYDVYVKLCKKLDIPRIKGIIRGPHSYRRNIITFITNATNGNIQMAASLCGNHTEVAQKNYYTGPDLESSKNILDMRNKVKIS